MQACTKTNCFMASQCIYYDAFLRATKTYRKTIVYFKDMYKPDDEGKCLNFEFKSDTEKAEEEA